MLKQRLSIGLSLFLLLLMLAAALNAQEFGALARYFPLSIAIAGAILALVELVLVRNSELTEGNDDKHLENQLRGGLSHLAALAAYLVAITTLGFFSATVGYLFLAVWKGAGLRLLHSFVLAVAACAFLYWSGTYIGLAFPAGFIDNLALSALSF